MRIWSLLIVGACMPSNSFTVEHETDYETEELAAGTEVFIYGENDIGVAKIDELDVSPADKAVAKRITDQQFAIQTFGPGPLHVHAVIEGDDFAEDFNIIPVTIGPMRVGTLLGGDLEVLPPVLSPRPTAIGVFVPTHVFLEEPIVDANNQTANGHTIEPWAPQDRLVAVKSNDYPVRRQFELTPDATPVAVSVGGETISFVTVEPNTATRFVLVDDKTGTIYDGTTAIPTLTTDYFGSRLTVLAYDASDRLVVGEDVTVTSSVTTSDVWTAGAVIALTSKASGTSSLTVTYDGLTMTFPVITP